MILELVQNIRANHPLKRKFKIFLGVGFVGSLLLGALFIWGGIAAFKSIASIETNPVVQEKIKKWNNSEFKDKIPSLEAEINKLPALAKIGCWTTAKSLMSIGAWLEKPIAENYNNLKSACLKE
jgi:hypothetical protein